MFNLLATKGSSFLPIQRLRLVRAVGVLLVRLSTKMVTAKQVVLYKIRARLARNGSIRRQQHGRALYVRLGKMKKVPLEHFKTPHRIVQRRAKMLCNAPLWNTRLKQ